MIDPIYSIVFSTAFLGSGHCIGMCGPVVAAISLARQELEKGIVFHLLYNCGRIITYIFIGIVAGWFGSLLNTTQAFSLLTNCILILADLLIIMIGLRASSLFDRLAFFHLEIPGSVEIMTKAVSVVQKLPSLAAAFPIGLIMGFLPCGFLYAIALAAAGRGSPLEGAKIMFAFGLGTLPALFLFGSAVQWLSSTMRAELLRWAGFMVVFIGCFNLYQHIRLTGWFG